MRTTTNCTRREAGFTLIELLIVVAILGTLAAMAIQQYALYRVKAFDGTAQADLRNAATAEEALYATTATYITCADAATCEATLQGYKRSTGVNLSISATDGAFSGTSTHVNGSGKIWSYDTQGGRIVFAAGG